MEAQSESWICSDCQAGRHTCFICNDEGDDGKVLYLSWCECLTLTICNILGGGQMWMWPLWEVLPLRMSYYSSKTLSHTPQGEFKNATSLHCGRVISTCISNWNAFSIYSVFELFMHIEKFRRKFFTIGACSASKS